ncbi:hypothetical protein N9L68_03275 [bacterium]|nr:hypothetical protein [bacterium]
MIRHYAGGYWQHNCFMAIVIIGAATSPYQTPTSSLVAELVGFPPSDFVAAAGAFPYAALRFLYLLTFPSLAATVRLDHPCFGFRPSEGREASPAHTQQQTP